MKCFARLFFISLISCSAIIFYSCSDSPKGEPQKGVSTTFKMEGMTCPSCKNILEGALQDKTKFPLIHSATVDYQEKTCTVIHDKSLSIDDLKDAIHTTKYRVVQVVPER